MLPGLHCLYDAKKTGSAERLVEYVQRIIIIYGSADLKEASLLYMAWVKSASRHGPIHALVLTGYVTSYRSIFNSLEFSPLSTSHHFRPFLGQKVQVISRGQPRHLYKSCTRTDG